MKVSPSACWRLKLARPFVAAIACVPLLVMAQATPASLAGPSIARVASSVVFQGNGFAPNSAVSVSITLPSGSESHFGAVSDAKGQLAYKLSPSGVGKHTLKVLDTGGRTLASTAVNVIE